MRWHAHIDFQLFWQKSSGIPDFVQSVDSAVTCLQHAGSCGQVQSSETYVRHIRCWTQAPCCHFVLACVPSVFKSCYSMCVVLPCVLSMSKCSYNVYVAFLCVLSVFKCCYIVCVVSVQVLLYCVCCQYVLSLFKWCYTVCIVILCVVSVCYHALQALHWSAYYRQWWMSS